MANLLSIGRPYALAAFEYARDKQQLATWKAFLESASAVARDPAVAELLANPEISPSKLLDFFHDVLTSLLDTERNNFLLLLAQNRRLNILPEIAESFNLHCAAYEKMSNVRVITAIAIEEVFKQKLAQSLKKRMQHEVTLQCEVDPSIIGGAIIHMGDRVIDGSVRGKLTRLLEFSLR